jgi:hypothetical protein
MHFTEFYLPISRSFKPSKKTKHLYDISLLTSMFATVALLLLEKSTSSPG